MTAYTSKNSKCLRLLYILQFRKKPKRIGKTAPRLSLASVSAPQSAPFATKAHRLGKRAAEKERARGANVRRRRRRNRRRLQLVEDVECQCTVAAVCAAASPRHICSPLVRSPRAAELTANMTFVAITNELAAETRDKKQLVTHIPCT